MASYLVTGGCGFIGSHLCEALLERGHTVRVLDNLATGRRENLPPGCELMVGDIRDEDLLQRAVKGIDGAFHLAAIASVRHSVEDWSGTHAVNLTGFIRLLDTLARSDRHGVPVVYASSAAVYGDNASLPLTETDQVRPITSYGADKLGCELHARVACRLYGMPVTGLRFFNVYGPRQLADSPYSGVISNFMNCLLAGKALTVYGDGEQTRDFIFVADVVRCLLAAADLHCESPVLLNVCTGTGTSVNQLAHGLLAMAPERVPVVHAPRRPGDIQHSVGDPSAMRRTLGLRPEIEFGEGLQRTLASFLDSGHAASQRETDRRGMVRFNGTTSSLQARAPLRGAAHGISSTQEPNLI